jgi:predicted RNA-binding protein YlqC (UPF0109 family)
VLSEAVEHLVKGIVDHPEDVHVRLRQQRHGARPGGRMLEVRVHPDDLGKVIGRGGRTATSIRTVVGALAEGRPVRVDFVDVTGR